MTDVSPVTPRRIIWEKWPDPFLAAVKEHQEKGWLDPPIHAYLERPGQIGVYQGPMLVGPAGFIPLNELNSPSKNFNLWVGHTSFLLDHETVDRMKAAPGVEVLKVWSPYRFWLGVARAFEENEVKRAVLKATSVPAQESSLPTQQSLPQKTGEAGDSSPPRKKEVPQETLNRIMHTLSQKHRFWALVETEAGKLDAVGSDSRETVEAKVREWSPRARRIFTSWERSTP